MEALDQNRTIFNRLYELRLITIGAETLRFLFKRNYIAVGYFSQPNVQEKICNARSVNGLLPTLTLQNVGEMTIGSVE